MTPAPSDSSLREAVRAMPPADRVTGVGCVLALLGVFLKWKGNSGSSGVTADGTPFTYAGTSLSGLHSWGTLTLLIALISAAYFAIRSPLLRNVVALPRPPMLDATFFLVAGVAEVLTVLLFSRHFSGGTLKLGFYVTILGGILTASGAPAARRLRAGSPEQSPATPPAPVQPPVRSFGPPRAGGLADLTEQIPGPPAVGTPDRGWYPDPSGEHAQRFWDGSGWTDEVRMKDG